MNDVEFLKKNIKVKVVKNNCNIELQGEKVKIVTPTMYFQGGITEENDKKYIRFEFNYGNQNKFLFFYQVFCDIILDKLKRVYPKSEYCYIFDDKPNIYLIKSQLVFKHNKFEVEVFKNKEEMKRFETQEYIQNELIGKSFKGTLELELNNVWHKNNKYGFRWIIKKIYVQT